MLTESEKIFESYCSKRGINYEKVTEGENKTPDYLININEYKIIIELTQFNINDKEKDLTKLFLQNKPIAYFPENNKRIRNKIKKKSYQLNQNKEFPTILMLYDNRTIFSTISANSIKYALYGNDVFHYAYNKDEDEYLFIDNIFGKGKTFTKEHKRYISAIALIEILSSRTEIILFHNYFAEIPLDINICSKLVDKQYKIIIDSTKQNEWIEINC